MQTAPTDLNCLQKTPQSACNVTHIPETKNSCLHRLLEEDEIRGDSGNNQNRKKLRSLFRAA
jgi:hypothetical protein